MSTEINKREITELSPRLQRYAKFLSVIGIVAVVITIVTAITIYPLIQKRAALQAEISQLRDQRKMEVEQKNRQIETLEQRIKKLGILAESLGALKGKRKKAVELALDLQRRSIEFKWAGRKPEDGGLDLSGFIDYILSQPEINIVRNPLDCGQSCLINDSGITKASSLSDLKPGDLIFYNDNHTMMYLGSEECIGMIWQGKVETRAVEYSKILQYGRVPYGD